MRFAAAARLELAMRSSASKVALICAPRLAPGSVRPNYPGLGGQFQCAFDDDGQAVQGRLEIMGDIDADLAHAFDQCRQPVQRALT